MSEKIQCPIDDCTAEIDPRGYTGHMLWKHGKPPEGVEINTAEETEESEDTQTPTNPDDAETLQLRETCPDCDAPLEDPAPVAKQLKQAGREDMAKQVYQHDQVCTDCNTAWHDHELEQ